jgi:hypothetical protein
VGTAVVSDEDATAAFTAIRIFVDEFILAMSGGEMSRSSGSHDLFFVKKSSYEIVSSQNSIQSRQYCAPA